MLMTTGSRGSTLAQGAVLRTYGVVFLVVLGLLVALTIAIYNKTFIDVVRVTLETDRVGNQLAPPADVKLRGMIVGEVRAVRSDGESASVELALAPETAGLIPADVRRGCCPRRCSARSSSSCSCPAVRPGRGSPRAT